MIELPVEKKWTGDGWASDPRMLSQVKRSPKHAIYRVTGLKNGETTGYEVFKIRVTPKGTQVFETVTPDDEEKYPTAEQFGKTAWAVSSIERAEEIFNRLEQNMSVREETPDPAVVGGVALAQSLAPNRRGRPKVERAPLNLPNGEFSIKELAEQNSVEYVTAQQFLKEQMTSNQVRRTRTERRAARGPETQLYQKI